MNPTRLAVLVTGMLLVLLAGIVAYYATPLRRYVPPGVAIAVLLLVAGLFVMAISTTVRRSNLLADDDIVAGDRVAGGRTRIIDASAPRYDRYDRGDDVEVIRHH